MKKVKVGVIGVGSFGKNHARIFSELPTAQLVGIADIQADKLQDVSKKINVPPYTDYKRLFGKVEAVSIAVPTSRHHAIATECLSRGVHVMVEKPISVNVREASSIIKLAEEKKLILQVGHLERFNPAILKLRDMIKFPYFISTRRLAYPMKRNLDAGVVWDLMIHDIDIVLSLVSSPVADIQARGIRVYSDFEDFALVNLSFENGCIASLLASRISTEKARVLEVVEKNRSLTVDFINQKVDIKRLEAVHPQGRNPAGNCNYKEAVTSVAVKKGEPLKIELEHFLNCIIKGRKPLVSGEDGKKALQLAVKISKSMKVIRRQVEK